MNMSTKPTVAPLLLPLVVVLASIALGVASVWAQPPSAAAEASNRDTAIDLEADVDADATDKPPAEDGEQDEPQAVEQQKQEKKDPSSTQQTQFAPGIVTVIPPAPHPKETSDGPHTLPQLLEMHPEIKLGGDTHPGGEPHFDPRALI